MYINQFNSKKRYFLCFCVVDIENNQNLSILVYSVSSQEMAHADRYNVADMVILN